MVKTKVVSLCLALAVSVTSFAGKPFRFEWEGVRMDGSRTGTSFLTSENVKEALGTIDDNAYTAPNNKVFKKGTATYAAARDMIEIQSAMGPLKRVVAYCTQDMRRGGANSPLAFWIVDRMAVVAAEVTGKQIDFALINSGGIREDMPVGPVMASELMAMLPFKNYISYVALKGSDLLYLIESTAFNPQPMYGATMEVTKEGKIKNLLVGGAPINPNKIYGVATVDFLLDGGDKINAARNAKELIITDVLMINAILPYAESYSLEGKSIEYDASPRVVFEK